MIISLLFMITLALAVEDTTSSSDNKRILYVSKPVQGKVTAHLPLAVFALNNEEGSSNSWFPGAELGVAFVPKMVFEDYVLEFPLSIQTIPPFFDDILTMGDISFGGYFKSYNRHGFGLDYRYLRAKHPDSEAIINAHIWGLDIGVPYKSLKMEGIKLEWLISGRCQFPKNRPKVNNYQGNAFFITPYWGYDLEYGRIQAFFRVMVSSDFKRTLTDTGEIQNIKSSSISEIEVIYTFP